MALLHCEGYSLYRLPVAAAAMRAAHAAGARVSLDLASFEVVQNCWAALDSLLQVRLGGAAFGDWIRTGMATVLLLAWFKRSFSTCSRHFVSLSGAASGHCVLQ